jgi:ubiquinone/menaquinone biosynthesis C-methylase UbiE
MLSYNLVDPLDWFQLRCLLWEAVDKAATTRGASHWSDVAEMINERCPDSSPVNASVCEVVARRIMAAVPEGQHLLAHPATGRRVWNHLLYSIVHEKFGDPAFMNLGYLDTDGRFAKLALSEKDEPARLFIQMYERTIDGLGLGGKDVLEVGCGTGGGAHYLSRCHEPRSVHGFDLVERNVAACRRLPPRDRLAFTQAAAEALPSNDDTADVVINIESSFTYDLEQFLEEVARVLRPGGYLLMADHRPLNDEWGQGRTMQNLRETLRSCKLQLKRDENITENVVLANATLADMKRSLLDAQLSEQMDRVHFSEILHCPGSINYERLRSGQWQYRCWTLTKS